MRLGVQPRRSPLQDVGNEKARTLDLAAMLEPAAALRPGAAVRRVRAQDHGLGTAGLPFPSHAPLSGRSHLAADRRPNGRRWLRGTLGLSVRRCGRGLSASVGGSAEKALDNTLIEKARAALDHGSLPNTHVPHKRCERERPCACLP